MKIKNKKIIVLNTGMVVFGVFLFSFIFFDNAKAANPSVEYCACSKDDSVLHKHFGDTINTDSSASCDQYCANQGATLFSYTMSSGYQPVTKTKGAIAYIAPNTCTCTNGDVTYNNALIGTFGVDSESGCVSQCQITKPGLYSYNLGPFKKVPPKELPVTIQTPDTFSYTLLESFPGFFKAESTMTDLPTMILAIYKFGIWTVGIAGLFMLVVGGFMYMASAGNTSTAGNARGIISDALLGIVAALGAYLILYVINPDLTKINLNFTPVSIKFDKIDASNPDSTTTCRDCVSVEDICKTRPCSVNSTLASKLRTALQGQNARITEGWPATVNHSSSCHGNGTCADVNLTANKGDVQEVKKLYDAI